MFVSITECLLTIVKEPTTTVFSKLIVWSAMTDSNSEMREEKYWRTADDKHTLFEYDPISGNNKYGNLPANLKESRYYQFSL